MIHRREIITLTSDNRHIPDKTSGFQHALYEVDLSTPLTQSNDPDGNPDGHCPTEGRSAVLSEKEKKLSAVVNLLNQALGNRYDLYIDLPREERIRALNAELAPITENITHAFPGIGAGYYNKTLDAIITYAPSALYQNNVGVTIAADHPGREVMRTNTPLVYSGRQVRGDILNSMIPIERNGEILGYIWANELTEDIRRQAWKMDVRIIIVLTAGLLISLLLIVLFSRRLSANIDIITDGLSTLAQNIPTRLPQLPGEMGQISQSVNNLAQALRETRTLNDLIIENAADGVIAIDRQGDVTTMNPAAEVITGYQRHELVGQPYSSTVPYWIRWNMAPNMLHWRSVFQAVTAPLNSVSRPVVFITRTVK